MARLRTTARVASAMLALAACAPSYSVGAPLTPVTDTMRSGAIDVYVPLADGSLLVDDGTSLLVVRPDVAEPTVIGESGEIGELRATAILDRATLIAGSEGTFVVETQPSIGIFRAPIEDALGGETITALATTARDGMPSDLWVATDAGLYLFRDAALTSVRIDGLGLMGAQIVAGGGALGPGSIWAATDEAVFWVRVDVERTMLEGARLERPLGASAIIIDGLGTVWMATAEGLAALDDDFRLERFDLPFVARRLFGSGDGDDVWFQTENGFFHQRERVFHEVDFDGTRLDDPLAGPDGTLYARTPSGAVRIRASHPLGLEGLTGGPILTATRVEVILPSPENVVAVRAEAGGTIIEVMGRLDSATRPPTFVLEPGPIPVGRHVLSVEADYDDGTLTARLSTPIEIQSDATWTNDIEPIYDEFCADCHAPTASARALHTRALWMEFSGRIIDNVRDGRMPLGRSRLPPSDIAVIQAWASAGFAE